MSDDTVRPIRIAMIATVRIVGNALAPAVNRAAGARNVALPEQAVA